MKDEDGATGRVRRKEQNLRVDSSQLAPSNKALTVSPAYPIDTIKESNELLSTSLDNLMLANEATKRSQSIPKSGPSAMRPLITFLGKKSHELTQSKN
jgi:hypothetical protein